MIQRNSKPASAPRSQARAEIDSPTPTPWTTRQFDTTIAVYGPQEIRVVSTSWHGSIRASYPLKAESLANAALIVKAVNSHQALLARIARLEADLLECREYLETEVDVIDGDYGVPAPNRAMALVTMIDQTLNGAG